MFASATASSSFGRKGSNFDSDSLIYINAVQAAGRSLSDAEKGYIDTYVVGLKSAGIWTDIYDRGIPIWGAEAPSLVTLKGVSTGTNHGATFSSTGADFDGASTYIDIGIVPSSTLTLNNTHISYYTGDTTTVTSNWDMGALTGGNVLFRIVTRNPANAAAQMYATNAQVTAANSTGGYFMGSRLSSTDFQLYKNGSSVNSIATVNGTLPAISMFIGCFNSSGTPTGFSNRNCQLWSVGNGLTPTQAADDYTLTQAFMTSMGIQV